jgi:hypothetical protein
METFDAWINQITAAAADQPCDELLTNTQVSQNMFITQNLISTLTSVTAASTMTASNAVSNSVSNSNSQSSKSKRGVTTTRLIQIIPRQIINQTYQPMEQIIILKEIHHLVQRLRVEELNKEEVHQIALQLQEEVQRKEEMVTNQVAFLKAEVDRLSGV